MDIYVDLIPLLHRLSDPTFLSKVRVDKGRKNSYGVVNYGEIVHLLNPSDGDCWDVFFPGVRSPLDPDQEYCVERVLGILLTPNGNHKIAIQVSNCQAEESLIQEDIQTFCKEYSLSHRFTCKWIPMVKFNRQETMETCRRLQCLFSAYKNNGSWGDRRTKILC